MRLYHVTSAKNQASIDATGLDPQRAQHGVEKAVWLVTRSTVVWALAHTAAKPGRGAIGDLVVYTVDVPRRDLKRFRRGIWRSYKVVQPVSVTGSATFTDTYPS